MKKADINALVVIIIVLLSVLVLSMVVYKYISNAKGRDNLEVCRFSVIAAANAKAFGQPVISISCPRRDLLIDKKNSEIAGKINEDQIKKLLAEEARLCWYKMGGDNMLNPYEKNWFYGTKNVCLICSEISFSPEVKESLASIQDFVPYLSEYYQNNIKMSAPPIYVFSTIWDDNLNRNNAISTSKDYYLIYLTFSRAWLTASDSFPMRAAKYVSGATSLGWNHSSMLEIISSDQLARLECGSLKG